MWKSQELTALKEQHKPRKKSYKNSAVNTYQEEHKSRNEREQTWDEMNLAKRTRPAIEMDLFRRPCKLNTPRLCGSRLVAAVSGLRNWMIACTLGWDLWFGGCTAARRCTDERRILFFLFPFYFVDPPSRKKGKKNPASGSGNGPT